MPKLAAPLDANSLKVINLATPTASTDAATKAYVDANAGGGASPFIYKSGLDLIAGAVTQKNGTTTATISVGSQGTIYYVPIFIAKAINSVTLMKVRCAASLSGATCRLGIYTSDSNGLPNTLLNDFGSISLAATGLVTTTAASPSVNIPVGVAWFCLLSDSASSSAATVNAGVGGDLAIPTTAWSSGGLAACGFSATLSSSLTAFPSTCDQTQLGTQFIVPLVGITLP